MRIVLHIGLPWCGADAVQGALEEKRGQLAQKGVLFSHALGKRNHTRLYMAVSDPGHVDPLRHARGFATPGAQERLQRVLAQDLAREVARDAPEVLVISAQQLATLPNRSEIKRLHAMLTPLSDDITVVAHIDEQARVLLRHYARAVAEGRTASLSRELGIESAAAWRATALKDWARINPAAQDFPELQGVPHWLDYAGLVKNWGAVFGTDKVVLRAYDPERFHSPDVIDEVREMVGLDATIGKVEAPARPLPPSAATLARWRALNAVFVKLLATGRIIPRPFWMRLLGEVAVPGDPIDPAALSALSKRFEADNKALLAAHPALTQACLKRVRAKGSWAEADPLYGFRASQYGAAFLPRIDATTRQVRKEAAEAAAKRGATQNAELTETGRALLSERAQENFFHLRGGRFAPHNRLGRQDEAEEAPPYSETTPRPLPKGRSGNVIVGCMKNEAPYILEWIAYHRQIGIDNFLIYTNDCTDGTDELLDRLQALGIAQRRNNDNWKGNSPQQYALNRAAKEPVVIKSDWMIHIDVDEFINIRTGNGTLDDFLAKVPQATNVAMTWRLFGHNGVERYVDDLVIGQFTSAAPKYCPKPHTTWGFKTMTKNTGAYAKLSGHRPNKLDEAHKDKVHWVNGSGQEMTPSYHEKGWRSDLRTIGYDLLQLNHYALRSAESFMVKRQRGRALHVDRSIGLNYWIRMDWGGNKDITIQRNIPRVRAELDRLLADPELKRLHEEGVAWHKAKTEELHATPEFEELYQQAISTDLTEMERVAFALALEIDN